jgi:hypothetical protein
MTANEASAVPRGGVPASPFGSPITDLVAADPPARVKSVFTDLLDRALAAPRVHKTRTEQWIEEPGTLHGGHWEVVEKV